jgi:hypothetical protein
MSAWVPPTEPIVDVTPTVWWFTRFGDSVAARNVPEWTVGPPSVATPSVDDRYSTAN